MPKGGWVSLLFHREDLIAAERWHICHVLVPHSIPVAQPGYAVVLGQHTILVLPCKKNTGRTTATPSNASIIRSECRSNGQRGGRVLLCGALVRFACFAAADVPVVVQRGHLPREIGGWAETAQHNCKYESRAKSAIQLRLAYSTMHRGDPHAQPGLYKHSHPRPLLESLSHTASCLCRVLLLAPAAGLYLLHKRAAC